MVAADDNAPKSRRGFFNRLTKGLEKTRNGVLQGLSDLVKGKIRPDQAALDALEMRLISADTGIEAASMVMEGVHRSLKKADLSHVDIVSILHENMLSILKKAEQPVVVPEQKPFVILVVGVNGAGKTTTIGKMALYFQQQGYDLLLAAGDTFRAAAIDQIQRWGDKINVPVISQNPGADSAAVIYNTLQSAVSRQTDILIADTAGRLHNQDNLMGELKKIARTIEKFNADLHLETLLVIDAGTGQNAIVQAQQFHDAIGVTGVAITKLDGTAKGGVALSLAHKLSMPIRFIGAGEQADDLRPFDADQFLRALLGIQT